MNSLTIGNGNCPVDVKTLCEVDREAGSVSGVSTMLNTITSTFPMPKNFDNKNFRFFHHFRKGFSFTHLPKCVELRVCVLNLKVGENQNPSKNEENNERKIINFWGHWKVPSDGI